MKKWMIGFVFIAFTAPALVFADGKADYNSNCVVCHGGDGKTNTKRGNILKIDPKKLYLPASGMNKDEMISIIEKGKDQMPSFEKNLTKDQIAAIVDYIKSMTRK